MPIPRCIECNHEVWATARACPSCSSTDPFGVNCSLCERQFRRSQGVYVERQCRRYGDVYHDSREGFGFTRIVWNAISPCHQLWLVRTAVCCSRRSTLTYRRWLSGRFGRRFSARVAEGGISWLGTDRGCNDRTARNAMHRFIIFRGYRTGKATDTQPYPPLHPPPKEVVAQRLWLPSCIHVPC